jgi:hypothetical protein
MRTRQEVDWVMALRAEGLNGCQIARRTGIPRGTVKGWLTGHAPDFDGSTKPHGHHGPRGTCPVCIGEPGSLPQVAYTYLLGLYLGDGCLTAQPRGVYRLRITCARAYPELMRRCEAAMSEVLPNKVARVPREGCTDVTSFSKHWICLFPQHGPGRKHERRIELTAWQQELIDRDPRPLLEGLLHSDGCRVKNWVNGTPYPRYHFTNYSADIRAIFGRACDALGIEWTQPGELVGGEAGKRGAAGRDRGVEAMRPSGGRFPRHGGPAPGLALAGLLLLAACTGRASPGDRRSVAPGTGGCPVASGDGGWRRLAVLTGSGAETAAEVTGVTAGSNGQP